MTACLAAGIAWALVITTQAPGNVTLNATPSCYTTRALCAVAAQAPQDKLLLAGRRDMAARCEKR